MANFCDGCDEDPVTHEVFKDPVTGELIEHHFCADCPKAKGIAGGPASEPVIKAKIQSITITTRSGLGPCPTCGLTLANFRETGRLGCSACYKHFEDQIGPLIARSQEGATHHVGKLPRRALSAASSGAGERSLVDVLGRAEERARKLTELRDQLQAALAGERYEQAAMLRDQIDELRRLFEMPGASEGET
ncbi:MAG TPA: hypothetical protein ENJ00_01815 [Phycisphaerales bacterium]|nr:hypothetical protein [Phycisphaerales bacterium]